MESDIVLNTKLIRGQGLTINEYLILYNIANKNEISSIFRQELSELTSLETRGWIKITSSGIFLRARSSVFFTVVGEDPFIDWLKIYPVKVKKRNGGSRSLSPESENTVIGRILRKKWNILFRKDKEAQERAVTVLKLQILDMEKSGDLEYMVEARRWLNEGYFEKYAYLIEDGVKENRFKDEDYY